MTPVVAFVRYWHEKHEPAGSAVKRAMGALAGAVQNALQTGELPEYVILADDVLGDITISDQYFFDTTLEEAIACIGVEGVKVKAGPVGHFRPIAETIQEKYPTWAPDFAINRNCWHLLFYLTRP